MDTETLKQVQCKKRGGRVVEGARLESVYTATYRGFESLPLCKRKPLTFVKGFFISEKTKACF